MISVNNHWRSAKIHTACTCRKQQTKRFLLHGGVIALVFVKLFTQVTNGMFNTIHSLEQTCSYSHIRGVNCHLEGQVIIRRYQNWPRSQSRLNIDKCVFTTLCPSKFAVLFEQLSKRTSGLWVMRNKSAEISCQTKPNLPNLPNNGATYYASGSTQHYEHAQK